MVWLKNIWQFILLPYQKIQMRKRLKELRKRDPFIYK
jgi:hypothetical protein